MVQIQLKAKHFYLISYLLFKDKATISFSTLEKIKDACVGLQDDDLTSITTESSFLIEVFKKLSMQPEGSFNQINQEMLVRLQVQIATGISNNDPEWINISEAITDIRDINAAVINEYINYGKGKLYA